MISVKSLTFTLDVKKIINARSKVFVLRSNLSTELYSNTYGYNDILSIFKLENHYNPITETVSVKFENPISIPSNKQKLKLAHFQLCELSRRALLPHSKNNKTIINCSIYPQKMDSDFNVILESNDTISKNLYTKNNATKFNIQFPSRYNFYNQYWSLCLKSINLSNKIFNVPANEYKFRINYFEYRGRTTGGTYRVVENLPQYKNIWFYLPAGYYPTTQHLADAANKIFLCKFS